MRPEIYRKIIKKRPKNVDFWPKMAQKTSILVQNAPNRVEITYLGLKSPYSMDFLTFLLILWPFWPEIAQKAEFYPKKRKKS